MSPGCRFHPEERWRAHRISPHLRLPLSKAWQRVDVDGREIALAIGRTPSSVRAKAVGLGVFLCPRKREWHRMRILIEPTLQKAITLAARRRGMRSGDLARRVLTAVSVFDLYDVVLDAHSRVAKVSAIETVKPEIEQRPPAP
jgi:hypothetical protein